MWHRLVKFRVKSMRKYAALVSCFSSQI